MATCTVKPFRQCSLKYSVPVCCDEVPWFPSNEHGQGERERSMLSSESKERQCFPYNNSVAQHHKIEPWFPRNEHGEGERERRCSVSHA